MLASYVRGFIRSSLVWFAWGILIGVSMAWWPEGHMVYRPAHAHANLLGFVSMFIFGVSYHVIPRFVGRPMAYERAARAHVWIQNAGLALLEAGWLLRPTWWGTGDALLKAGAVVSAVGVGIFVWIIWRTTAEGPNAELTMPSGRSPG